MSNLAPLKNNLWWNVSHAVRHELGETRMHGGYGWESRKVILDTLIERNEVIWQVKQNMIVKRGI